MDNRRFHSGLGVALGLLAVLALGAAPALASVPLTQVSSDPYTNTSSYHKTEVEADGFAFGSTMISAFQAGRFPDGGASNVGWARTGNAGGSYSSGFLPGTTVFATPAGPFARDTDPSVAYDRRHNVWMIETLGLTVSGSAVIGQAVIVNRSTDGGLTFGSPVTIAAASGGANLDKNWIVCDDTSTSPHYGNCYAEWDDNGAGNQLHMAVSSDGGLTWTASTVPSAGVIGGQPLVQPKGNVIVPIDNAFEGAVESFVSTNGGASYSGPFTISAISHHPEAGGLRSPDLPTAEMNSGGKIYVVWSDCRFRTGCAENDLVFSTSSSGTSWSAVKRIPIDATTSTVDHFLPGLAVDRKTGGTTTKLGLTYYYYPNTSCTTATCQLDVGFVGSTDAGSTWTAPTQLAGPSSLNTLPDTSQGFMVGDYLSTSFVKTASGDLALSVFGVGMPVSGTTCTLGSITSCNEPMEAPTTALPPAGGSLPALAGPVLSTRASGQSQTGPLTAR